MACSSGTGKIRSFLKRIVGKPVGSIFPLTNFSTVIGRGQGSDICIPDNNISRNHCVVNLTLTGCTITDCGGINGTYLNSNRLKADTPTQLKDGMVIFLGPPEDSPCGFVFVQHIDGVRSNEAKGSLQDPKSTSLDKRHPSLKRGANPHTVDVDPSKRFKTEYVISTPVIPGKNPSSPRVYDPKSERLLCIVGSRDSAPGPSITIECSGSELRRQRCGSRGESVTYIVRRNEPVPGPSLAAEPVHSDGNVSNCSISSLDSLRTRIRKKKKRESRDSSKDICSKAELAADTSNVEMDDSASPQKAEDGERSPKGKEKKTDSSQPVKEAECSPSHQDSGNSQDSQSLLPIEFPHVINFELESSKTTTSEQRSGFLYLKERVLKLQKRLLESSLELKKMNIKNRDQIRFIQLLQSKQGIPQNQLLKLLEDEMCCNICTEILIKPTTLNCAHTFCEHCISVWKKKKKQCPMCREAITSETGIKVMENFINKASEYLDRSYQLRRSDIIHSRELEKDQVKKKGRKTRKRSSQIRIQRITNNFQVTSPTNPVPQTLRFPDFGRVEMVPTDVLNENPQNSTVYPSGIDVQVSDGSESSVEGSGYYGGFGRCYNCGRRGHWSNGCPGLLLP